MFGESAFNSAIVLGGAKLVLDCFARGHTGTSVDSGSGSTNTFTETAVESDGEGGSDE